MQSGRAFSDTILDRFASDVDADYEKASVDSISTGCSVDLSSVESLSDDDKPRSSEPGEPGEPNVWVDDDEVEANGISVSSPIPLFWMSMPVAPLAQKVMHAPGTSDTRTTIMLRNLPRSFTRAVLFEILEDRGFRGGFNFVYVPSDFARGACLGYGPPERNSTCNFDGVRIFIVPQTIDLLETIQS